MWASHWRSSFLLPSSTCVCDNDSDCTLKLAAAAAVSESPSTWLDWKQARPAARSKETALSDWRAVSASGDPEAEPWAFFCCANWWVGDIKLILSIPEIFFQESWAGWRSADTPSHLSSWRYLQSSAVPSLLRASSSQPKVSRVEDRSSAISTFWSEKSRLDFEM